MQRTIESVMQKLSNQLLPTFNNDKKKLPQNCDLEICSLYRKGYFKIRIIDKGISLLKK